MIERSRIIAAFVATFEVKGVLIRIAVLDCPETVLAKVKLRHDLQNSSKASKQYANLLVKQPMIGRLGFVQ